jgi:hypothetical protein
MKALNLKQRKSAQWKLLLLFAPIVLIVMQGTAVHFKVFALQEGDLIEKELQYEHAFKVQAQKGEVVDVLIRGLQELRDSTKTFMEFQNAQKAIHSNLVAMQEIQTEAADTHLAEIPRIPAIYDSLASDILLIQSTRDSIKTVDENIKNRKFQLDQCLEALKQGLAEQKDPK